jgi:hypothetical protein
VKVNGSSELTSYIEKTGKFFAPSVWPVALLDAACSYRNGMKCASMPRTVYYSYMRAYAVHCASYGRVSVDSTESIVAVNPLHPKLILVNATEASL